MPHDPLEALRGAQSIGPPAWAQQDVQRGEMPLGPGFLGGIAEQAPAAVRALQGLLGRQKGIPRAAETLGEVRPEFTPRGGEDLFNVGRSTSHLIRPTEPNMLAESAFAKYAGKGMPPKPPAPPSDPLAAFYRNNPPASFQPGGGRMTGQFVEGAGGLRSAIAQLRRVMGIPQ